MKYKIAFFAALLLVCLSGCETLNINKDNRNALVIKPARHSNVDPGALTNEGTLYYSFGSLFFGGLADYEKSSAPNCEIFHGAYTVCPRWDVEEPLVSISAVWYNDVEYTKPGQAIERICITGLDESLGLGSTICIPMKQGKYKGGNDLIRKSGSMLTNMDGTSPSRATRFPRQTSISSLPPKREMSSISIFPATRRHVISLLLQNKNQTS